MRKHIKSKTMSESPSFFEKTSTWIKTSVTFKIVSFAILILLMLIPTSMVESLIYERQYRQEDAVNEISSKWGHGQTVSGPILTVPYYHHIKIRQGEFKTIKQYAHFLPSRLNIDGVVEPHLRYRGIYEAVLYTANLNVSGEFERPDFEMWKISTNDIIWDEAFVSLGVPDMRGINESIEMNWNDKQYSFGPGIPVSDIISTGVSTLVVANDTINPEKPISFSFDLSLNGSKYLNFLPVGRETFVSLKSEWKHPSFSGQFLPDDREISEEGFQANWKVLQLNRDYPQQWLGDAFNPFGSQFGVTLKVGVNQYQKNTRSAKYSVLIIALTFTLFFFIEVINKKRIHPLQYLLVGFALSIFYALLLAISEHSSFGFAYLISSIAVIGLIVVYVHGMLKKGSLTVLLGGALALIYGFIYVILQSQDYALLIGSVGLFIVLTIIMYFTRNIDWYSVTKEEKVLE